MKSVMLITMCCFCLVWSGCSGDKSKELLETAQFEEKQHNQEHAEKLYQELVSKYPNSSVAKQAQERLAAIRAKR